MLSDTDEILAKMAGNVVANPNPCDALKVWRKRLKIRQIQLAKEMKVSPSVLSDYESGRRSSPGVVFIKKYLEALIRLDRDHERILDGIVEPKDKSAIIAIGEFKKPVHARLIVELVKGEVLKGKDRLDSDIYGYTVLDSIKAIYALSGFDFYRIFGTTTERALIFTRVGLGRSPLVAIRVSQLKPRMVILHGPKVVDPLAIDLAEKERIILVLSSLPNETSFLDALNRL
ncbi:MAG: helix-turn-helix domain-containing protein [archaeon]|nr:helix-turn-helix domain-containing protein [archaeon]